MISLCITTYNRYELLMESFAQVLDDDRISEIVIVDDCSTDEIYGKVLAAVFDMPKVRLYRNQQNLGMSLNKKRAVELAKNEWVILFDSDNIIAPDYLNNIDLSDLRNYIIYCPSFARPQFDYRSFSNYEIDQDNVCTFIKKPLAEPVLNTCNYLVNRGRYLSVYEPNPEMKGTDTIWFNYLWLKAGNSFYVVPGMEYYHRVHEGSGFLADCDYNMRKAKEIKELIKAL